MNMSIYAFIMILSIQKLKLSDCTILYFSKSNLNFRVKERKYKYWYIGRGSAFDINVLDNKRI